MIITLKCPGCGAEMDMDTSKEVMYCTYCGTKVANVKERVEVTHTGTVSVKRDLSNEPNLYVTYNTSDQTLGGAIRIDDRPIEPLVSGMSKVYRLSEGQHIIYCRFGRKTYDRKIYINKKNEPVRVDMVYNGDRYISINQPDYEPPVVSAPESTTPKKRTWWGRNRGLVVGAYFLFFTIFFILGCITAQQTDFGAFLVLSIIFAILTFVHVLLYFVRKKSDKKKGIQ